MPETYDISLGGVGYSVAPKSYKRGLDSSGNLGAAPVRQVQREWAGALRPVALERDRHARSLGVWPLPNAGGAAFTAGPLQKTSTTSGLPPLKRRYSVLAGGRPYMATGGILYRPERGVAGTYPNNFAGLSQLGTTLPQAITGLCADGGDRLFVSRQGAGYALWPLGGGPWDTTASVLLVGCAFYAGSLWGGVLDPLGWRLARVTAPNAIEGTGWPIDSAPLAWLVARDALYFTTATALYRVAGSVVAGAFSGTIAQVAGFGGMGYADDGQWLAEYNGELYVWLGGEVCRHYAGTSTPARWQRTGLRAGACTGLAAAGGKLWAALADGDWSLWSYDGIGWWQIADNPDGAHQYAGPASTGGYFTDADLLTYGAGIARVYAWQLHPTPGQVGLAPSGELVTSLWCGRDPDANKLWTRAGIEVGQVGSGTGYTPCTVALDHSLDGGATWTLVASATVGSDAPVTIAGPLPASTRARALALRARLSGVIDGAPALAALWAEYRGIEPATHRRAWDLEIVAADDGIRRNGSADSRRGTAIAAALWAAFDSRAILAFRDVDYDTDPTQRQVQIASLTESIPRPADAGRWSDTSLRVRLVEV